MASSSSSDGRAVPSVSDEVFHAIDEFAATQCTRSATSTCTANQTTPVTPTMETRKVKSVCRIVGYSEFLCVGKSLPYGEQLLDKSILGLS